jgi:hypothetical protein
MVEAVVALSGYIDGLLKSYQTTKQLPDIKPVLGGIFEPSGAKNKSQ